jgi:hypothetical protein
MMKKSLALLLLLQIQSTHAFSAPFAVSRTAAANKPNELSTRLFNAPRHDVRGGGNVEMDPEEMKIQQALAEHQQNAVR